VFEAADGRAALDHLRAAGECTIVLLDMVMPGGSGLDVLRAVAADQALAAKHAIVLVTATPSVRDPEARRLLERLRVPVVAKPFDIDELHEVVAREASRVKQTAEGCQVV
jgi:CheY-like chemotaxis protein